MKLNSFDHIYIVSERFVPISMAKHQRAEGAPGTESPRGFGEFIVKFGKEDFGGYLVSELATNRESLAPDFWDDSTANFRPPLTRALAGKGFRITEHNRTATLPGLP